MEVERVRGALWATAVGDAAGLPLRRALAGAGRATKRISMQDPLSRREQRRAWRVAVARGVSERHGLARFAWEQSAYSLLDRTVDREMLPFCANQGVGFTVPPALRRPDDEQEPRERRVPGPRAARRLFVTQSAVSHALARLRAQHADRTVRW